MGGERLRGRGILLLVALSGFVQGGSVASAHPSFSRYIYKDSGCAKATDPINVIFTGPGATAGNSGVHLDHHEVSGASGGASFYFTKSHGTCIPQGAARKSDFHYRLFDNLHNDSGGTSLFAAAAGHHDYFNWDCVKDAVYKRDPDYSGRSGYDAGASQVLAYMQGQGGHLLQRADNVPNRRRFRQCNGDRVRWNGRIIWMNVG